MWPRSQLFYWPRPFAPSTFVFTDISPAVLWKHKKRNNKAAPGVPNQVSHPSAFLSQSCLTQKWSNFSLLHWATLQLPDNINSDQKSVVFASVSHQLLFRKVKIKRKKWSVWPIIKNIIYLTHCPVQGLNVVRVTVLRNDSFVVLFSNYDIQRLNPFPWGQTWWMWVDKRNYLFYLPFQEIHTSLLMGNCLWKFTFCFLVPDDLYFYLKGPRTKDLSCSLVKSEATEVICVTWAKRFPRATALPAVTMILEWGS